MKTNVYIDGFNLYYGLLRRRSGKWLDLEALCDRVLPEDEVHRIRYFTAKITARSGETGPPKRQDIYLRALRSLPRVSVHLGQFLESKHTAKVVTPPPKFIEVAKTEEKGSDVNLASWMLLDAFNSDAERFVVLSNDSDLLTPLSMVKDELGYDIGILNPHERYSRRLASCGPGLRRNVRRSDVNHCQFPQRVELGNGRAVTRPREWQ
jgi:uncharacterized LabA/DUF88 family protein